VSDPEGRDSLEEIAGAVADGTPVDWAVRRQETPPRLHGALDHLSVLERIKEVHAAPLESTVRVASPLFHWGHLHVIEKLGAGSWGEVYRAFDPTLQRDVALKLLTFEGSTETAAERFLSEARSLARLRHPNVVTVFGADRHDGRYGIWTELIRGQTLQSYVEAHGALGAREAGLIGLDLCRALSAVHGAGLVHRDIKAGNVMREEGGRIVLMDFGSGADLLDTRKEGGRHIYGTPLVMAPEQFRGESPSVASDMYGVGALLYWLVSRAYPIEATTFSEVAERHAHRRYVPLRDRRADLPLAFVQVVERAIAPEAKDRYPSAGAFEQALAATMPRGGRRWRWISAAAAAVITAIVVALLVHHPVPPPIPKPQPPARVALSAEVSVRRLVSGKDEAVPKGGRIGPGDRLSMLLRGTDSMYVYVLNEDQEGHIYVLFPIPGLEPGNPLPGKIEHELPGRMGENPVYWKVTNAGGKESIVTVASRGPLADWERLIRKFPVATRGRPVVPNQVRPEDLLRGMGGLSVEPPQRGAARRFLADAIRSLEEAGRQTGDIWIWTTELENPRSRSEP